jgi:small-conductance mechanosensitive channel
MLLDEVYWGNPLSAWLIALGIAVGAVILLGAVRRVVVSRVRTLSDRTANQWDDVIADTLAATKMLIIFAAALAAASTLLDLAEGVRGHVGQAVVLLVILQVGFWAAAAARSALRHYRTEKLEDDPGAAAMVGVLTFMVYLVIWAGVVLFALDNLGVDITALVAGLGIGGVAIALALQNVLGDLFASLAIVLDKPFVLGDFVRVDDMVGTVEHVGLKTTRIRALSGEQLVFANNDILGSRLQNFGRMFERRIVFTVGVTYQTPRASLEKIPGIIQDAIEAQDDVRFDRSHLSAYGDFSINFESVWFVLSPDFATYMDRQQAIYFAIHEAFEHAAIEFAYPTQTLFLERGATHEPS